MSGTILNQKMFTYLNGIPEPISTYYNIESPFLAKNRPIYYMPRGRMTYKIKETTFKNYIPILKKLLNKYKSKKGIIHTITYELQKWLTDQIIDERFITHISDQKSKNFALKSHYTSNKPTVLISPSMGTGIDLKNERARFQICLKVPYPNLSDLRMKRRIKDNPEYYAWVSIGKILQLYGRAIRSDGDYADLIILDSCFGDLLRYNGHFFPNWVIRAIKEVKT
jgi:Rad3-related DNA helicase